MLSPMLSVKPTCCCPCRQRKPCPESQWRWPTVHVGQQQARAGPHRFRSFGSGMRWRPRPDRATCPGRLQERHRIQPVALFYGAWGYPNVRNYDGSWTEWVNGVRLPVEK